MKKYYKEGSSYYELDFGLERITCVTENLFNNGIVVSQGLSGPFDGVANRFSSSMANPSRLGEPTELSNEEEFTAIRRIVYEVITSASLNL